VNETFLIDNILQKFDTIILKISDKNIK